MCEEEIWKDYFESKAGSSKNPLSRAMAYYSLVALVIFHNLFNEHTMLHVYIKVKYANL
jgi:hypothetical protein